MSDGGHLRGCFSAARVRFCSHNEVRDAPLHTARGELRCAFKYKYFVYLRNKQSEGQWAMGSARLERELREARLVEEVFVEAHAAQVAVEIGAHRRRARRAHAAAERQQVPRALTARAARLYQSTTVLSANQVPEE